MKSIVTQTTITPQNDVYLSALASWESCKPPYTGSHMKICVTAAKTILKHLGKPRRSKYEKENYLRIDFSKAGKVTIYAEYPKSMGLKGRKLGEWPELTLPIAREKAQDLAKEGLTAESVHQILDSYENDLRAKVERKKLGEHSFYTYSCRIKQLRESFEPREIYSDVTYQRLIDALDAWIETKSNNQAFELFGELRRFWKFAAPLHCGGKNIAASIPDDYISSRVQRPTPTRRFTDIESIAQLWINVAACTSVHQKNAMRYMILTGVRPINVSNLRWEYVNAAAGEIVYPAGLMGMRGAMKTQKEFRLPITPMLKIILDEQKSWSDSVDGCNRDYVFLQPKNIQNPFSKRSLDKIIKTYSPENALKGVVHEGTIKGKSSAFNTMCRKFLKSNIIAQMRARGYSRSDTREISQLCMHHSDNRPDPMGEHYDFSDEILQEEIALKRQAFEAHENSIMTQVALLRRKS
ncbi:integrase family protein [Xenorhabdus budapestensis]|uniref:Integrase family protein n=1 Tax=Xenorhabdus budapestensis TaxID=290110 RepID=A0ABX7VR22_XENBU|nr:integrase family protein [Xenorhabdus budapestensis]QTL40969.1 integrase family protein [Xenorhabdus budapestensis]